MADDYDLLRNLSRQQKLELFSFLIGYLWARGVKSIKANDLLGLLIENISKDL